MRSLAILSVIGLVLMSPVLLANPAEEVSPRAMKIHQRAIVVDTHADTTQRLLSEEGFDFLARDEKGHVDLPRMREGGLDAAFFSIYIPATVTGPEAVKRSLRLIDSVRQLADAHPSQIALATTAADVRRAHKQHKIAALMGMEGGHMIDNSLRVLRMYAALGVRYLTLTHGRNTDWGDSSTDTPAHNGLTDFGKQVVHELNRLGVMVDISHVSDQTFYDALETSRAPLIASHSSCRALCDAPRNMTDDMIRALAGKGGVIQITYVNSFLSQDLRNAQEAIREEVEAKRTDAQKSCGEDAACRREAFQRIREEYAPGMPKVSWEKIIEHIDHAVKIAGIDHVGLGSDFDGATMPEGMDDCSHLPQITDALLKKGYSRKDVEKILGRNLLRVMEQVERVSKQMRAEGAGN